MTPKRKFTETMKVLVRSPIEPGDSAVHNIQADVRGRRDRHHLGRRLAWKVESHMGKGGGVAPAKAARIAAADGGGAQGRQRQGRPDDADIETPKILLRQEGLLPFLRVEFGLFVDVRGRGEPLEQRGLTRQRLCNLVPGDAAHVPVLLVPL